VRGLRAFDMFYVRAQHACAGRACTTRVCRQAEGRVVGVSMKRCYSRVGVFGRALPFNGIACMERACPINTGWQTQVSRIHTNLLVTLKACACSQFVRAAENRSASARRQCAQRCPVSATRALVIFCPLDAVSAIGAGRLSGAAKHCWLWSARDDSR
jgi:hypothetical protein